MQGQADTAALEMPMPATSTFGGNAVAAVKPGAAGSLADNGSSPTGSESDTYALLAAALAAMGFVARRRQN
jgi:hypothetical protein